MKSEEEDDDDDDDDDQQDSYREGHHLHSARLLRDDASYGLGDTDVGISLERWESEYQESLIFFEM